MPASSFIAQNIKPNPEKDGKATEEGLVGADGKPWKRLDSNAHIDEDDNA